MGKTSKIQENYAGKNSLRLQNEGSIARNLPGDAPQLRRRLSLRRRAAAIPCGGRPGGMCAGAENRLWIGAFTAGRQSAPTVQEVSPCRSKKRNPPQSAEKPGKAGGCGPLSTPGFFDRLWTLMPGVLLLYRLSIGKRDYGPPVIRCLNLTETALHAIMSYTKV